MPYETILLERVAVDGGIVALVTLNRPEVRNAINLEMIQDLGAMLDVVGADPDVRAIVIQGSGDKAFAAGADIAELKERGTEDALRRINAALFRRLEEQPIPAIAAVRGYALGGGCELAMACDVRVAGESAKFGQPEVGLGIIAGAGAIQRLPRLVGMGRAKELLFTGRIVDAAEAERIGLVNQVVPDAAVLEAAMTLARSIAQQGGMAVRMTKMAVNVSARPDPSFELVDVLGQAVLFESPEKHARMQAFLDKKAKRTK